MKTNTRRTFRFFYRQVKNYRFLTVILLISLVCAVFLNLIPPYFYKIFFDSVTQGGDPNQLYEELLRIILMVVGINVISGLFWRVTVYCAIITEGKIMRDIYNDCFEYLHRHSYNFFNDNFVGSLVKKVGRLVRSYEVVADRITFDFIPLFLRTAITLVMLFLTNRVLGWIFLVWIVFFLGFNYLFAVYKLKFDIIKANADSKVTAVLADTISNQMNLKLFASLAFELKNFKKATESWFLKSKASWIRDNLAEWIQGILMTLLEFLVFFFALKFWKEGKVTIGDFVLIQTYLFGIFQTIWGFGRMIRALYESIADAEEMVVVLNTPHEVRNYSKAKPLRIIRGQIEFKNVTFAYDKGLTVFDNLSFKIKPGEKVALVGLSGEGKSTAVKLLLRFFDIDKGEILIDGQNIKKATLDSLREQISLVPQDPVLFHRNLFDNIRYGARNAEKKMVVEASKLAYCDEFITKFPFKYETFVGERGIKLSGGQKQRVAIARAILRNSPILVLDEATSSLDSYSEKLIQKALQNLMKNRTSLVIAHRLSTIAQMDRILVVQNGKIVEEGTHKELLQKKTSLYKKLWKLQTEQQEEGED